MTIKATPERIAKIPQQWIRDYIAELARQNRYLTERCDEVEAQLALASGSHAEVKTNVRLQAGDIDIALPPDSVITFQGKFEVTPSANDPDGIDVELYEPGALVIVPAEEGRIYVRRWAE